MRTRRALKCKLKRYRKRKTFIYKRHTCFSKSLKTCEYMKTYTNTLVIT